MPRLYFNDRQIEKLKQLCEEDPELLTIIRRDLGKTAKPSMTLGDYTRISLVIAYSILAIYCFYNAYWYIGWVVLFIGFPYGVFFNWNENVGATSSVLFFSVPFSITVSALFLLTWLFPELPQSILVGILFGGVSCLSCVLYLLYRTRDRFLEKAKVALDINYFIFFGLASFLVIYAYFADDFSKLLPLIDFGQLQDTSLSPGQFLIWLCRLIALPFLLAVALLKALIGYDFYRRS